MSVAVTLDLLRTFSIQIPWISSLKQPSRILRHHFQHVINKKQFPQCNFCIMSYLEHVWKMLSHIPSLTFHRARALLEQKKKNPSVKSMWEEQKKSKLWEYSLKHLMCKNSLWEIDGPVSVRGIEKYSRNMGYIDLNRCWDFRKLFCNLNTKFKACFFSVQQSLK